MIRPRFSLRTLFVIALLLAIALAAVANLRQPPAIVRKIETHGGSASALRSPFLGFRRFERVDQVVVDSDEITDDDLRAIAGLKSVSLVHVKSRRISDNGVLALGSLRDQISLDVASPHVTDEGLSITRKLNISYVEVTSDRVNGAFLESYPPDAQLFTLLVHSNTFNDESVRPLQGCPFLTTLI
jgi:hypothetical protein